MDILTLGKMNQMAKDLDQTMEFLANSTFEALKDVCSTQTDICAAQSGAVQCLDDTVSAGTTTIQTAIDIGTTAYGWQEVSANEQMQKTTSYLCDSTAGAFTLTLPATPVLGDKVSIIDSVEMFKTNNVTIDRNGEAIMGLSEDMLANVDGISFDMVFKDAARGWVII
jgi:hypothetical protein